MKRMRIFKLTLEVIILPLSSCNEFNNNKNEIIRVNFICYRLLDRMILTLLISTTLFDEKLKNRKRKIHNLWFTCQFTTIII